MYWLIAGVRGRGVVFRRAGPVADLVVEIAQIGQLGIGAVTLDCTGQLTQCVVAVTPRPAIRQCRPGALVLVVQCVTVDRSIVHCNIGQTLVLIISIIDSAINITCVF